MQSGLHATRLEKTERKMSVPAIERHAAHAQELLTAQLPISQASPWTACFVRHAQASKDVGNAEVNE